MSSDISWTTIRVTGRTRETAIHVTGRTRETANSYNINGLQFVSPALLAIERQLKQKNYMLCGYVIRVKCESRLLTES